MSVCMYVFMLSHTSEVRLNASTYAQTGSSVCLSSVVHADSSEWTMHTEVQWIGDMLHPEWSIGERHQNFNGVKYGRICGRLVEYPIGAGDKI